MADEDEITVADIVSASDALTEALERYLRQLEAERPTAEASDDPRYVRRVIVGIDRTEAALDLMDDVLEHLGGIRHTQAQLEWARQGKMV